MKKILSFFTFIFFVAAGHAQQQATSSFYTMYPVLHNPASAGASHYGVVGATFKKQWSGMPGGPQTALIFGSTYLPNAKIGVGGYLYSDETGPTKRTGLQMAYAYHIATAEDAFFSIGIEGRFQQFSFDRAKLQASLGNDPALMGNAKSFKGDAGFGISYNSKKIVVGASVSQLVQSKLNLYESSSADARLYRHFYVHGQYNWDVDGYTHIVPNALVVYLPNAPTELQAGVNVEHNNVLWYGFGWRMGQGLMMNAGVKIKEQFSVGYAFDMYRTPLNVFSKGGNGSEVMLRYDFTPSK